MNPSPCTLSPAHRRFPPPPASVATHPTPGFCLGPSCTMALPGWSIPDFSTADGADEQDSCPSCPASPAQTILTRCPACRPLQAECVPPREPCRFHGKPAPQFARGIQQLVARLFGERISQVSHPSDTKLAAPGRPLPLAKDDDADCSCPVPACSLGRTWLRFPAQLTASWHTTRGRLQRLSPPQRERTGGMRGRRCRIHMGRSTTTTVR